MRTESLFNNDFLVFRAPNATILLINVASKVKMSLIARNDFSVKFRFIFMQSHVGGQLCRITLGTVAVSPLVLGSNASISFDTDPLLCFTRFQQLIIHQYRACPIKCRA